MKNDSIRFDDWQTRYPKALEKRRKDYIISEIFLVLACLISAVLMFFEIVVVLVFILFLIITLIVYLEWLKVKNNEDSKDNIFVLMK